MLSEDFTLFWSSIERLALFWILLILTGVWLLDEVVILYFSFNGFIFTVKETILSFPLLSVALTFTILFMLLVTLGAWPTNSLLFLVIVIALSLVEATVFNP